MATNNLALSLKRVVDTPASSLAMPLRNPRLRCPVFTPRRQQRAPTTAAMSRPARTVDLAASAFLRLSSRGEALVAELLRLSDHIPRLFLLQDKAEQKAYGDVLLDFRYLKTPELFEHRIESSAELVARDEDVWENHGDVIVRFFTLFESIYKYAKDFARCLEDLREGVYIQQTLEGVLLDEDGKQLICEVLYLYGVLLLLMDARIDGTVRERMLIAYYRHKGASSIDSG